MTESAAQALKKILEEKDIIIAHLLKKLGDEAKIDWQDLRKTNKSELVINYLYNPDDEWLRIWLSEEIPKHLKPL